MVHTSIHRNSGKTSRGPRRPFEKERLDAELQYCGKYGLRCKREVWRVQLVLAKIRKAARVLLTLEENNPKRLFEGAALLRRLQKYGLLTNKENPQLDDVLELNLSKLLDRRLQTILFKMNKAKSIHDARVTIRQRHIRVGNQMVDVPSFMVTVESEKHVDLREDSTLQPHSETLGRVRKMKARD